MAILHFVNLFISRWTLHCLPIMTDVAMNISVQVFVGLYDISYLGYIL